MNKKGSYFMSPFWWVVLGLVAVGVVIGVISVRGQIVDIRPAEADILYKKIIDCLIEYGELVDFSSDFNLENYCGFNFTDNSGGQQYYIEISLYDSDNCDFGKCTNPERFYEFGLKELKEFCGFGGKTPFCYGGSEKQNGNLLVYTIKDSKPKFLDVFIAIGKVNQNVK
ncbi:hypothetical protein HYV49_00130 [Candidatus Pacearchaeota archaeon]|nr:hypothetical protein [Candidatus Pacearchaeota archaeon]